MPAKYPASCNFKAPLVKDNFGTAQLLDYYNRNYLYFSINPEEDNELLPGTYLIVPQICGDCTVLGEIEKPDFWID